MGFPSRSPPDYVKNKTPPTWAANSRRGRQGRPVESGGPRVSCLILAPSPLLTGWPACGGHCTCPSMALSFLLCKMGPATRPTWQSGGGGSTVCSAGAGEDVGVGPVPTLSAQAGQARAFSPPLASTSPSPLARPGTKAWMCFFSQSRSSHQTNRERGQRATKATRLLNRGTEAHTSTCLTPKPNLRSTSMPSMTGLLGGSHLEAGASAGAQQTSGECICGGMREQPFAIT